MKLTSNSQNVKNLLKSNHLANKQLKFLNSCLVNVYTFCKKRNVFAENYSSESIAYLDVLNLIAHKKCLLPREGDSSQLFVKHMLQLLYESLCRSADTGDSKLFDDRCNVTKSISLAFDHINSNIDCGFETKLMEPESIYPTSRDKCEQNQGADDKSDNSVEINNATFEKEKTIFENQLQSQLSESSSSSSSIDVDENDDTIIATTSDPISVNKDQENSPNTADKDLTNDDDSLSDSLLSTEVSINKRRMLSLNDRSSLTSFAASTPQITDEPVSHLANLTNNPNYNNGNNPKSFIPKGADQMSPLSVVAPTYKDSLFPRRLRMSSVSIDNSNSDSSGANSTVIENVKSIESVSKLTTKELPPSRLSGEVRAAKIEKCRQILVDFEARKSQSINEDSDSIDKTIIPSTTITATPVAKSSKPGPKENNTTAATVSIIDATDSSIKMNGSTSRYSLRPRNNTSRIDNNDTSKMGSAKKKKSK